MLQKLNVLFSVSMDACHYRESHATCPHAEESALGENCDVHDANSGRNGPPCGSHAGDRPQSGGGDSRFGFQGRGPGGSQREVTYCLDRALNERLMAYMERSEAKGLPRRLRIGRLRRHGLATGF